MRWGRAHKRARHILRHRYGHSVAAWDARFQSAPTWSRYKYVPFHQLSPEMQRQARAAYPHKSVGAMYDFADEHYYYPLTKDGRLPHRAPRHLAIPHNLILDPAYMASLGYTMNPGWPK
jgi:hypothetical protein